MFLNDIIRYFCTIHNGKIGQKNVILGHIEYSSNVDLPVYGKIILAVNICI